MQMLVDKIGTFVFRYEYKCVTDVLNKIQFFDEKSGANEKFLK